ncbi:hypothetical protein Anapl_00039 [Anas platyrhynchos]|uniref:Uncharacterized protein n=1 Tax=Anas platyrhynchos TaxID=8839 RepID=R0K1I5_ANAPL|nr:hypothetical protein Anapl_00039 [Anas platyrhynchos]
MQLFRSTSQWAGLIGVLFFVAFEKSLQIAPAFPIPQFGLKDLSVFGRNSGGLLLELFLVDSSLEFAPDSNFDPNLQEITACKYRCQISALLSVRDVSLLVRACFPCSPCVEVQQSDVWKGQSKTMVKEVMEPPQVSDFRDVYVGDLPSISQQKARRCLLENAAVINGQLLNGSKCGPFLLERSVCGVFGLFCLILTSQFLHSPSLVGTGTAREQRHRLASVLSGVIFMNGADLLIAANKMMRKLVRQICPMFLYRRLKKCTGPLR